MPKIQNYKESTDETNTTQLADPQLWGWNNSTMYQVKEVNGYRIVGDFNDQSHTLYGLFPKDSDKVISAIDVKIEPGKNYNIPIEDLAIIEYVATQVKERGKGYTKILYEYILNKFKVLVSDAKIITKGSIGIWTNYLSSIANMFNYNVKTKTFSDFDVEKGNTEDVRFIAIKDDNIANKLTESFKDFIKKNAVKGAAALSLIGNPSIAHNDEQASNQDQTNAYTSFKQYYNSDTQNTMSSLKDKPDSKDIITTQQVKTPVIKAPIKSNKIDVNIISQIESSGVRKAISHAGAKGLCQMKKAAWDESQKSLYGKLKYPYEKYAFNARINKEIANNYYNKILPKHLDSFGLPINIDTLLASYNYGSTNVKNLINKYGNNWKSNLPDETANYLNSYKNLAEKK